MKFEAKRNELSKFFISLKDGEEVIGVFKGEPHTHFNHWDNALIRSFVCVGDGCKYCGSGDKKKFRFRLNMILKNPINGMLEAKILEGGRKLYSALSEINNDFPLESNYLKIRRTGKTMNDTVYTVLPSTKLHLTDQVRLDIEKVPALPLDPSDAFWNTPHESSGFQHEEEVPF